MTPQQAADRLIALGYFKYLPESERVIAQAELTAALCHSSIGTRSDKHGISRDRRIYPADNEELAEGRVGEFLLQMHDVLVREGVSLDSVEDDVRDGYNAYDVVINGRAYPVFDAENPADENCWSIALKRFLEIGNQLLQTAGSEERLYGMGGGNDGRIILLTPAMYTLLDSSGLLAETDTFTPDMPYPPSAIGRDSLFDE